MRFLAVFALVAVAEMATFFWVGSRIGLGWALALAVLTAVVGSFLVRRAGLSVLGRIRARLDQSRLPGRELIDGAAILVSGAFLISPGFITDIMGFLLLIPFLRDLAYGAISKRFSGRFAVLNRSGGAARRDWYTGPDLEDDVIDVEGWER